jgi:hypothetical protein
MNRAAPREARSVRREGGSMRARLKTPSVLAEMYRASSQFGNYPETFAT